MMRQLWNTLATMSLLVIVMIGFSTVYSWGGAEAFEALSDVFWGAMESLR